MLRLGTLTRAPKPEPEYPASFNALIGLGGLIAIVLGLALGVAGLVWEGYVLVYLWNWFILPYFQLPALTIPLAIGLVTTVRLVTQQVPAKEMGNLISFMFLRPGVMLLIGWVIKTYYLG
jgi:hypothetical protein